MKGKTMNEYNPLAWLMLGYAIGTVITACIIWAAVHDENRVSRKIDRMVASLGGDHE